MIGLLATEVAGGMMIMMIIIKGVDIGIGIGVKTDIETVVQIVVIVEKEIPEDARYDKSFTIYM